MFSLLLLPLAFVATIAEAAIPTRTFARRTSPSSNFVTSQNGQFSVHNAPLKFVGTNAYWLSALNSDADINKTLHSIKAAGLNVVRTWAFNDVPTIPVNGTWFQLIKDGKLEINTGKNGLQRLDKVIELAEQAGLFVMLSLTNNWNPLANEEHFVKTPALTLRDVTAGTNNTLPRNFLSNDYGGIDAYVRGGFGVPQEHSQFYSNQTLLNAFMNYTTQVVSRYVNSTAVFAWELANDPRCNSSLPAASTCTPQTITTWHNTIANHIRSIDPNHLVSSGTQGFLCIGCPKIFTPPNQPQPSLVPVSQAGKKRSITLTREGILRERAERWKRSGESRRREEAEAGKGAKIRGRWAAPETKKRQSDSSLGNGLDGSQGVDSQDILNIPNIDFGTFQLFTDQNSYGPNDPSLSPFQNSVDQGITWINLQGQLARDTKKPTVLTAFGLVTQENAPFFVPFNLTCAPFSNATTRGLGFAQCPPGGFDVPASLAKRQSTQNTFGVSTEEQDSAYEQWLTAASLNGVSGADQYQWSEDGLTTSPGTTIEGSSPNSDTEGSSPNDGYGISPIGTDGVSPILTNATSLFG